MTKYHDFEGSNSLYLNSHMVMSAIEYWLNKVVLQNRVAVTNLTVKHDVAETFIVHFETVSNDTSLE